MSERAKQVNLNTAILGVLLAILGWGGNKVYEKVDAGATSVAQITVRLTDLDKRISEMVTRAEFYAQLARRDEQIAELQKILELDPVRRQDGLHSPKGH